MAKGEIWEGFLQNPNLLDMTMSRASAAFYQELKGGATTLLEKEHGPLPPKSHQPLPVPPRPVAPGQPAGRGGSQSLRPTHSAERVYGRVNAAQWENKAKEAPGAVNRPNVNMPGKEFFVPMRLLILNLQISWPRQCDGEGQDFTNR